MVALVVSCVIFLLLDQWSKIAAQTRASRTNDSAHSVLRIRYVAHRNFFYQRTDARIIMVILWFAGLVSVIVLRRSGPWFHGSAALVGLGCALGGAAGNLSDILRRRHVVDFIAVGWWPVFNLADVGIVGGLALAFLF